MTVTNVVLVGLIIVMVEVVVEKPAMAVTGRPETTVTDDIRVTVVKTVEVARSARALGQVVSKCGPPKIYARR